ncbi:hypothetical protein [Actinoplanes sp. ATCC 53533]|uniref:hypothetical protein n=1 Tax=Actinoplanes sp. ATCC 53533 TaxID=1288362 RepID=UPI0013157C0E|nr:hypothetical protein [Actinoplanes sp. ATCC 53533]
MMRPVQTMLGAAILAVAAPLALAAPAYAADPLAATIGFCDSGLRQFICLGSASGGVAPVTLQWSPAASGRCTPNRYQTVTLTAVDSAGATATDVEKVWCTTNQWP